MGRPEADIKEGCGGAAAPPRKWGVWGGAGAPPQNTCFFVVYGFGFEIIQ